MARMSKFRKFLLGYSRHSPINDIRDKKDRVFKKALL